MTERSFSQKLSQYICVLNAEHRSKLNVSFVEDNDVLVKYRFVVFLNTELKSIEPLEHPLQVHIQSPAATNLPLVEISVELVL